jgi:multiple sugar transport system ATP-binding protein
MAQVTLNNLYKAYEGDSKDPFVAVKNINLEIRDREFMVLVGPSGCGKSTTLRMIAGLEEITDGTITIGDRVINDILPKNRDIAMVFQNYALYPHMTVYDNMAFGLKLQRFPKKQIEERVMEAAGILGIESMLDRKPKALSGGQRQRVAVGRAIVRKPKVFLFDEPLSNLDAKMRVQMRTEISKLHAKLNATMIYVTHDQVEAMTMGDRITVMKDGHILQVDEPMQLYNHPATMFVGGFIGSPPMNFIHGRVESQNNVTTFIEDNPGGTPLQLRLNERLAGVVRTRINQPVVLGIRPEDIADAAAHPQATPGSTAEVMVEVAEPMGSETYLYLHTGTHPFIARVNSDHRYPMNVKLKVHFNLDKAHCFDPVTERVLGAA